MHHGVYHVHLSREDVGIGTPKPPQNKYKMPMWLASADSVESDATDAVLKGASANVLVPRRI